MKTEIALSKTAQENVKKWLTDAYDHETKNQILALLESDPKAIEEAFYSTLSFGTGGIRGLMGIGCNRINVYTIRELTQGLVNYIKKSGAPLNKIVIGYDTRVNSRLFAEQAAQTITSNGFHAYLFEMVCPTPVLSYAVRKLGCQAGIMITASHNPPTYNGYKVYWSDGAQVLPPHDTGISKAVDEVRKKGLRAIHYQDSKAYEMVGGEVIQSYLQEIKKLVLWPDLPGKDLIKILYTPLHGTGSVVMEQALHIWGMYNVGFVKPQMVMDGNFPTTPSPNPESPQALSMGIDQMMKEEYDIFCATDPDADRLGVVVRHEGKPYTLTGNQIGSILAEWICKTWYEEGRLPPKPAMIKTIVTTPLINKIAEHWNVHCFDVLTGFKYIAEKIRQWEEDPEQGFSYVFGGEESLGFLYGTIARDKDGILASCVISEIAAFCKKEGKTLIDALHDIWKKYGLFVERLKNIPFEETKEGREKLHQYVLKLRKNPPLTLANKKIIASEDVLSGTSKGLESVRIARGLPSSDVLIFHLEGGGLICVRPSGTEPKIKLYGMLQAPVQDGMAALEKSLEAELNQIFSDLMS